MKVSDEVIAELKQKRDELRVQFNLGSRALRDEIREEWEELEEDWKKFSTKAELQKAREEVSEEFDELAGKLKQGWNRLREKLGE